jgi:hypothetical protein
MLVRGSKYPSSNWLIHWSTRRWLSVRDMKLPA